jgi:hypothetical protein
MFASNTSAANGANYIEDVFSTWLYTGNGTTQTITNGIDLSTKGGLVWIKNRLAAEPHQFFDTARGLYKNLNTNNTAQQFDQNPNGVSAFNSNGFSVTGTSPSFNQSGSTQASWTFRKQPKFFDVLTYTGTGSNTTVAHNLGSVPGCIFVKRTDTTGDWQVYHRSLANTQYMVLNSTAAVATGATRWNSTTPTSTVFSLGTVASVNASGGTYVAYLFAHDAGGFGLTGADNVISCGSFTTNSVGNATVSLGYEPQWVLYRPSTAVNNWKIFDNMRGMVVGNGDQALQPNLSDAEVQDDSIQPAATGFSIVGGDVSATHIYITIRRGPMKVPTTGTSVYFTDTSRSAVSGSTPSWVSGFVTDMAFGKIVSNVANMNIASRLTGTGQLFTTSTVVEGTDATYTWDFMQGWGSAGSASSNFATWMFKRAPGFFDEVCYTGTGANTTQTHNLGVVPELIIVKRRDTTGAWDSYSSALANTEYIVLNTTAAKATGATRWNSTTPTSSVFSIGTSTTTNASGGTYIAYLFATCVGVSKVGTYTGNGTTQTIDCGITAGARFVLIKRTDSTGDWYVYDTARGMTVLTDPYLLLNSTAAEVATLGSVTTVATGFALNSTILAAINVNAGTYLFLAIA